MLEAALTKAVLNLASKYVENFRTDAVCIWGGEVFLQDLELRKEDLSESCALPPYVEVKRAFIKDARIKFKPLYSRRAAVSVSLNHVDLVLEITGGRVTRQLELEDTPSLVRGNNDECG
eukprot:GHVU01232158.1.p2 GENE.GHVU01232158.1~~GHVU01232158.1.p2  ORF type:complete len:119 (-),score=14.59 GHVU01232158.1:378-734(-)